MVDSSILRLVLVGVAIIGVVISYLIRKLYPKPYPGIPYNKESANRLMGDLPLLIPLIKKTNEFSEATLAVTTKRLGVPIAQLLLPGGRKMIVLEDAREIEDLLIRRGKEFDRSPMTIDLFTPMFPRATISQYTTPELKIQKRLWADAMGVDFLRRAAARHVYKSTLELVQLWHLRASTPCEDDEGVLNVLDDLKHATLDAVWVAVLGEELGTVGYEIKNLRSKLAGQEFHEPPPAGSCLEEQVVYLSSTIFKNSSSPFPKYFQKFETYTPRYRRFRRIVTREMRKAMGAAVKRFQNLDVDALEKGTIDTCAMDLVLRRQALQARKAGAAPSDPTKDEAMLDELFILIVGGFDSTANTLAWFVRFMEFFPAVQTELRTHLKAAFPGPGLPTVYEILDADLPYLDAAVEEIIRLAGTAKGNLRQALVDTQILGYPIPKGADIFMNGHINHAQAPVDESRRSETSRAAAEKRGGDPFLGQAGCDLGELQPRRWLTTDKNSGKEVFNPHALPELAFGGGYRMCFGRKLAIMELKIMTAILTLAFEFQRLPEKYRSMASVEAIFRHPKFPVAKLKVLVERDSE